MDVGQEYRIHFAGLKEGMHEFSYELGPRFFELFDSPDCKTGHVEAEVRLNKRNSFLEFTFRLSGTLEVVCDRCLDAYDQPVSTGGTLIVKFGENLKEESDELIVLPVGEDSLDISQYLYEYIVLALPLRRVHPDRPDGKSGCNPGMLAKIKELSVDENEDIDPRWDQLKRLTNNKN